MEKASVVVTRWFIDRNILPAEDEELYVYAVHCLLITISPLFLVLIIGACLDLVTEGIAIIIPFMIIRSFSGGIHSESPGRCFIFSTVILLTLLLLAQIISNSKMLCLVLVGGCIGLIICSPIENENKPLSIHEKKLYKRITAVWVSLFATIYFILSFLGQDRYAVCIVLGVILTSALQLPCLVRSSN